MAVAELLAEHGSGDEVLAAALLHDVVEDSDVTVEDLRQRFGDPPAALVDALSDDESIESYQPRKDEHRGRVAAAGGDALAIYGADKLTNIATLRHAYADQGEAVAEEFKVPLDLKVAIWEADLELLRRDSPQADRRAASPARGT
jgi:(p)ppGpp synthase/HD superfamily hydrolase